MQTLNFWAFFSLAEAFFIACLGSFILSRGTRDKNHILLFLLCISISVRCIAEFGFKYTNENYLWIWQKIDAFWALTPTILLHFSLIYTNSKLNIRKLILIIIYIPALFFAFTEFFGFIEVVLIKTYFGYEIAYSNMSIYTIITLTWGYSYFIMSLFLLFNHWKEINNSVLKKRLLLLFWMIISVCITAIILDHILKIIKIYLPITSDTFFIIGAVFISYGIIKYDLFSPDKEITKKIKDLQAIYFLKNTSVGIIHEMKNKFFALVSKVDLLQRRTRHCDRPECVEVVDMMQDNAREINAFINKILLYVKQEGEPLYSFDLSSIINEAVDSIGSLIPAQVNLSKKLSHTLYIRCNANDIKSVVVNLLLNALDAIKDGKGELLIHAAKEIIKGKAYAKLSIKDNGAGIPQQDLDYIFDLMYTTKDEGSGFGLFFVKKVVEKYQGKIEVQSEPGKGTTFNIYLPLEKEGH
ncbi:MAG: GHKL domain-containing protein [Spirochaetales bacterium]|nr:GHKL domain-containing protein [Spirochaetales bacterium]